MTRRLRKSLPGERQSSGPLPRYRGFRGPSPELDTKSARNAPTKDLTRGAAAPGAAGQAQAPAAPRPGWGGTLGLLRAGSLALPILLLLVWGGLSWRAERARGEQEALANAELLGEYAMRVLQRQDGALAMVETILSNAEREGLSPRGLHDQLAIVSRLPGAPLSAGYVTRDGVLVASSRLFPVGMDVSDRSYFRALRDAAADVQRLDRQVLRPSGEDALVFTRRRPGGGFTGLLFAAFPVEAFTGFFGRIAKQPGSSATLLRRDGMLLVRHTPDQPATLLPPDAPAMRAIGIADRGIYSGRSSWDGVERIHGFVRVEGHPLYANFGIALAELHERWLAGLAPVAALLSLTGVLAFATLDRAARAIAAEDARRRADARLAEAERDALLHEKLLRELHHRVKNSLALVQSLSRLYPREGGPDRALERRVLALGKVHDLLHVSEFASRLDLAAFLRDLGASREILDGPSGVRVEVDADQVEVDIERASPVALIAAELISNALHHGFPAGGVGRVRVTLRAPSAPGAMALLSVADDGIGMPDLPRGARRRSGLDLVRILAGQIGGRLERKAGDGGKGTEVSVTLPVAEPPAARG